MQRCNPAVTLGRAERLPSRPPRPAVRQPDERAAVDRTLDALRLAAGAIVLDTGCGSGEMLLRALERDPTWRGLGVDLDEDAIAEARRRAAERLPGRDVRFEVRDAGEVSGRHDAVLNVGSSHVHGGYPGRWACCEAWSPTAARSSSARATGASPRRTRSSRRSAARPRTSSTRSAACGPRRSRRGSRSRRSPRRTTPTGTRYEETLAANAERAGEPESLAYARRIRERRALPGGPSTLGFALLLLRAA